jgi:hypothetical protein
VLIALSFERAMFTAPFQINACAIRYEMALNFRDLRVLSLSDGQAHDTLAAVTLYLRQRTGNGGMARPIFSLLGKDATETFAKTMARKSARVTKMIQERWSEEQENAQKRVDAHWKEVQEKKKKVAALRARLAEEESDLRDAKCALGLVTQYKTRYYLGGSDNVQTNEYMAANSLVERHQWAVKSTERQIEIELQAPPPVIQPLPESESEALPMLFLLYMPESLRALANLSFAAQEAVLPPAGWSSLSPIEKEATQIMKCDFDWIDHHASHQKGCVIS